MSARQDFRSQLIPAFTPEQADAIVVVVTQAYDTLATNSDLREIKADVREIKSDVSEIKSDVSVLKADVSELKTDVGNLKVEVSALGTKVDGLSIRVDRLDGFAYELKTERRLYALLGRFVRRCRVLPIDDRMELIEQSLESGLLTEDECDDLRRADILARGKLDGELVYLVIEVSCTGDIYDVDRAARRAALLTKTGRKAIPLVACVEIAPATQAHAASLGVRILSHATDA